MVVSKKHNRARFSKNTLEAEIWPRLGYRPYPNSFIDNGKVRVKIK
jgi:hypothetical protein